MAITNDVSTSGIRAAHQRMAASAHNTANLQTDAFERQRVSSQERPAGGVQTRLDSVELSAQAQQAAKEVEGAQNNADTASETVERISARHANRSNVEALRAQDRSTRTLLDVVG